MLDEIAAMADAIREDGPVVKGSRGQKVANPLITEARQHRIAMLRIFTALGLDQAVPEEVVIDPDAQAASNRGRRAAAERWGTR